MKSILITGGAGFTGSHLTMLFVSKHNQYHIINLDSLTYAGNLENLTDIKNAQNYTFNKGNITDGSLLKELSEQYEFDGVLHYTAESHVDRSISDHLDFLNTNVMGTACILQVAKNKWKDNMEGKIFYQISTDEVYGSLGDTRLFTEETAYYTRSAYCGSKASSDHFVRAFYHTCKLPVNISNCSHNYGPYHFP